MPLFRPGACLRVSAEPCPNVLLRVLGLIAQQAIVPAAIRFERRARSVRFEIELDGLAEPSAQILLEKARAIVTVRTARLVARRREALASRSPLTDQAATLFLEHR